MYVIYIYSYILYIIIYASVFNIVTHFTGIHQGSACLASYSVSDVVELCFDTHC
jgi:hypothetical protein